MYGRERKKISKKNDFPTISKEVLGKKDTKKEVEREKGQRKLKTIERKKIN